VRSAVINLCRSRFRRKVVPLRAPTTVPSAEVTAAGNARREAVLHALATLPTRQREVVALRYFGGLSTAETAVELSIAEGTVKAHLHRGLAALREQLEDQRHG
jgi:RNA polymerase sigma factor (sigma-70 family)